MAILSNRRYLQEETIPHNLKYLQEHVSDYKRCLFVSGCPSSINGLSGSIRSPNYPSNYNNNHRCSWRITVSNGYRIELTFQSFSTESCCDYLKIFDGPSTSSPLLVQLRGTKSTPLVYLSSGSSMRFYFYTDHSVRSGGFYAMFRAGM